jgi:putative tricarboxylic transport membrane protein
LKFNDALWGVALLLLGGVLFVHVQSFPPMPGQRIGPGAMPSALAVGLGLCGALLLLRGLRGRAAEIRDGRAAAWVELPEWFGSAPQVQGFAVLVAVNLLYVLFAQQLGFVFTGIIYLFSLMAVLRVPVLRALVLAVLLTLLIHFVFYKLLRVPLPWGVLRPFY